MKVLLVGNYQPDGQESMQRFAEMLRRGLEGRGLSVDLVHPPLVLGRWLSKTPMLGKWLGYADKYLLFPGRLKRLAKHYDVVHICDQSNASYTSPLGGVPHVVTCHDLIAIRSALGATPEHHTRFTGRIYQRMILRGLKSGHRIICVSEKTREDLVNILGVPAKRLSIVHNGLNYPYRPMPANESSRLLAGLSRPPKPPFLLHVGGNQWYKNRTGVVAIFNELHRQGSRLGRQLVLAGKPWSQDILDEVRRHGLEDNVIEMTGVSNEILMALYSQASALLFPSLYEGFGWPIAEAQACGCPVIASNRAPMTEVGGDAAIYIDPTDPSGAARAIMARETSLPALVEAGKKNARRFDPHRMIDEYIAVYSRARVQSE